MTKPLEMTIRNKAFGSKATILRCGRVLRSIRGRRIVYEGLCNEKPAVIKIFLSALRGKHHFKRELQGLDELSSRGLQTANVIAFGQNSQGHFTLVLEKIEDAPDLFTLIEQTQDFKDLDRPLNAVFAYIATMHAAGIVQQDMHLGNFLWDGQAIYALDPAEMKFTESPIGKTVSFRQLAILFASLPESVWAEKEMFLKSYFQTRQWDLCDFDIEALEALTAKSRHRHIAKMLRKTLRTSKRYIGQKQDALSGVFARDFFEKQDIATFLFNIDSQMENGQILKRGNSCLVSKIRLGDHDVVVKRYNHKSLWHSFRHTLKRSRARRCWLFGHRLMASSIPCARPVAFIEQRKHGLIWQSYILNEYVNGHNIEEHFQQPGVTLEMTETISRKTRSLLENLGQFHMTHGDLKAGNILISEDQPVLIDLDSMKWHRSSYLLQFYRKKMENNIEKRNFLCKKQPSQ